MRKLIFVIGFSMLKSGSIESFFHKNDMNLIGLKMHIDRYQKKWRGLYSRGDYPPSADQI